MLSDLVQRNRSYRRFDHSRKISHDFLLGLVGLARCTPSSGNLQPLKYLLISGEEETDNAFRLLKWARYLETWAGPVESEKPSAYIVVLGDSDISKHFLVDAGIAAQTMLLGATEAGLGGCIVASVERDALRTMYALPAHLEILFVLALGKPAESVALETLAPGGDIKYYRTPDGHHHVPKRPVEELVINAAMHPEAGAAQPTGESA